MLGSSGGAKFEISELTNNIMFKRRRFSLRQGHDSSNNSNGTSNSGNNKEATNEGETHIPAPVPILLKTKSESAMAVPLSRVVDSSNSSSNSSSNNKVSLSSSGSMPIGVGIGIGSNTSPSTSNAVEIVEPADIASLHIAQTEDEAIIDNIIAEIDISAKNEEEQGETVVGSNSKESFAQQEDTSTGKKKKSKGILNLKGKLEKMSLSKQKKEDKHKDKTKKKKDKDKDKTIVADMKDGSDELAPLSPRDQPQSSSPVVVNYSSSPDNTNTTRLQRLSYRSPSPFNTSPLRMSRSSLYSISPTNSSGGSNGFLDIASPVDSPLSLSQTSEGDCSPSPSPGPSPALAAYMEHAELNQSDELRKVKKLEKFFGDTPAGGSVPVRKLEKMLGEVPTNVFDRTVMQDYEDGEESVDIQEEGVMYIPRKKKGALPAIKGATLHKLIEKLTHHAESDPNFLNQFLFTYRSFTTPQELLNLLKTRFDYIENGHIEEESDSSTKNKHVVRLRVFNVLKSWLQHHWVDFQEDSALVDNVMVFSDILARDMNMQAKHTLVRIITKNLDGEKQRILIFSQPPPKPHPLPSPPKEQLSLLDIHPEEFARQITLLEYEAYKAIKPWELLIHTRGQKKSVTIAAMINRFNDISHWVQTEILKGGETPKQRAVIFSRLLEICSYLKELNNYNALMEILSGMNTSAIFRLKQTWAALSSKQLETFKDLNTLMSGNAAYKNLRNTLHAIGPPCIPYMGMYLTDLTFIFDGNPQYLENGYINFDKCRRMSGVIQEVIQYQQTPYCLKRVEEIQEYLKTLEFERDDDKIWKMSLFLEERNSTKI